MRHGRIIRLGGHILGFLLLACSVCAETDVRDEAMRVSEMAITTRIIRGGPLDTVRRISSASPKTLFCFTRVLSIDDGAREITHIWYYGDDVMGEYTLPVKGSHWRTYSKKVIPRGMSGDWRVEAVDGEGNLLGSVKFRMN